jgi:hypothetical protein
MTDLDIAVEPTAFKVSALPEEDVNSRYFTLTVEYRGRGLWAVMHMGSCLGSDGEWDWEPLSSSREDDWLETHRFDRETAIELAKAALPDLNVNGLTLADYIARKTTRREGSAR